MTIMKIIMMTKIRCDLWCTLEKCENSSNNFEILCGGKISGNSIALKKRSCSVVEINKSTEEWKGEKCAWKNRVKNNPLSIPSQCNVYFCVYVSILFYVNML